MGYPLLRVTSLADPSPGFTAPPVFFPLSVPVLPTLARAGPDASKPRAWPADVPRGQATRLRGEDIRLNKKLYVGNLPFTISEGEIRTLFEGYGPVDSVSVIMDRETGRPRGFAFVEMKEDAGATSATAGLNGHNVGGRALRVNEATGRSSVGGDRNGRL
jgi:RNA recognition motif-containing protein